LCSEIAFEKLIDDMAVSHSGEQSTTSDSVGPPKDNSDLTTTTAVLLVSVSFLKEGLPRDEFTAIVNDKSFSTSVVEAVLLSPAAREQLQVDACARRFVICDPDIDSCDFTSLQNLLCGVETVFQMSHRTSLSLVSRHLGNVGLERLFCG
jgi:hypothetical protein